MSAGSPADIIFDWNLVGVGSHLYDRPVQLLDETLRDGLQSPSVADPSIEDKIALVDLMDQLGIQVADLGLPGAGLRQTRHVTALVQHIRDAGLRIEAACAARTLANDILPIVEISQTTGVRIEVLTFLGASQIRKFTEGWTLDEMRRLTRDAVRLGVREGLPVSFVTEDTARAHPDVLSELFRVAIDEGAHRIIHCDTVGHATPDGIRSLFDWTRELLERLGAPHVGLDFHGHNDRGLALVNSLVAAEHGCDRLHGTALGLGERVGNTALDLLLVNLQLLGLYDHDLRELIPYCQHVARATGRPIPHNYPVVGQDAFRTSTGVHAAALLKARAKGGAWVEDRIYSGVPATEVGKAQVIEVGPHSGASNVLAWLAAHRIPANPGLVEEIVRRAKRSDRTLTDAELSAIVQDALGAR
ncbi:MAG: 2-isopropylmalate synthase [Deltaproteobacteria bacterium]|nr:MAG: 2-isopropylmalate synthase [Deltaproteobacteria bacterium]